MTSVISMGELGYSTLVNMETRFSRCYFYADDVSQAQNVNTQHRFCTAKHRRPRFSQSKETPILHQHNSVKCLDQWHHLLRENSRSSWRNLSVCHANPKHGWLNTYVIFTLGSDLRTVEKIEFIGEPNRSSTVRTTRHTGKDLENSIEKDGSISA